MKILGNCMLFINSNLNICLHENKLENNFDLFEKFEMFEMIT